MLAVALTVLEEETCSNCGTPAWIGHSTDNAIAFDVESSVCYGCAELEKDKDNRKGAKSGKGEVRYVRPHNVWEGQSLPSRHDSYMREQEEA